MSVFLLATMAERDPEVIEVPDDNDGDDWQDVGPINGKEAVAYKERVDGVFKMMSLRVVDDCKDAVHATVTNFEKLAAKHWKVMQDADVEVVVRMKQTLLSIVFINHVMLRPFSD